MYHDELKEAQYLASKKVNLLEKSPLAYLVQAGLAGMFVAVSVLFSFTIGGILYPADFAGYKIVMGASFTVALSLVMMCGGDLFTGNNLLMGVGMFTKTITPLKAIKLWIFCWLGNFIGSWITVGLFEMTGLMSGDVASFITKSGLDKVSLGPAEIFARGIFCNIFVCAAVWACIKLKSESGKLIMIFWCVFAFFTAGFEHSVANMSLLALGALNPTESYAFGFDSYFYNLLFSTLGNIVGGALFIGLPYFYITKKSPKVANH